MHIEKKQQNLKKLVVKLRMLQENIARIDGASHQLSKLWINNNYIPSYSPGHADFENPCFVSVVLSVSMSRVFVYNAVDVNKILATFLANYHHHN